MAGRGRASLLAQAIAGQRWDLAALCLLLGLTEALSRLPPDAIEGVLDVLDGEQDDQKETRGKGE